ncbi:MAG: biotin transporter BioY [Bacillota bacterium]
MKLKSMTRISIMAALTALGAFIIIPLPGSPVPVTLQLLFTFLAGGLLGAKGGFYSQVIYVLLGSAGLPIFAGGTGGIGALFGPSSGYIYGFLIAGYLAGLGKRNFKTKLFYNFAGLGVVYILGTIGLMLYTGLAFPKALMSGVAPFIPGDVIKVILAAYLTNKIPLENL